MNLPALCIRRPVMTVLLSLSIAAAGLLSYGKLPLAALPAYNSPIINVTATLPGASPETMATSVALPLEKQFSTISGLSVISSSNTLGNTSITLEFSGDRDIDAAAVDVQAALLRAQRQMPAEMTTPPAYRKINPADFSVLILALTSPTMELSALDEYAENWISPSLSTLDGVAQVQINGQKRFAVRVKADPALLSARNLTLDELAEALRAANANTPVGILEGKEQVLTIEANRQLRSAKEFAEIVIATRNGVAVRLRDVAQVEDSVENLRTGAWVDGQQGVILLVYRQPNANTVAVVDAIRALVPHLAEQLPGSVKIQLVNDRSQSIRDAIHDVKFTLALTIALVVTVILVFLRRPAATLITAVSLPISLLGTLALMYWLGYSLNNVSLLGITLAVGLVVDDAIVMLENIVRYREQGLGMLEASLKGSKEISFTIFSISISLVAIFIPIFFMSGVTGLMFHEFAVVVSLAIVTSAMVSLTLIPMLCSRYLRDIAHAQPGKREPLFERAFNATLRGYGRALDLALEYRGFVLLVTLATFGLTVILFQNIEKGLFPEEDTGQLSVNTEASQDISYSAMVTLQQRAAETLLQDENVLAVTSFLGTGSTSTTNSGRLSVTLKPRSQRPKLKEVVDQLRRKLRQIPGLAVYLNPVQNLRLGGRQSKSRYQYVLQSVQADELYGWAEKMQNALREDPVFRDVTSDVQLRGLQAHLKIDRDKANLLGVQIDAIRSALYSAFGDRQASTIYAASDSYPVILQVGDSDKQNETDLAQIYVRSSTGEAIPLDRFASYERSVGPTAVNHQGQLQAVTIAFNLAPGSALGNATERIAALEEQIQLPANIITGYAGDAAVFQQTQSSQVVLLIVAILVVYVLLGVLYESFIHPLTIIAGLPSALAGGLATLMLFNQELTTIAVIGLLMLIGIVKKNAIMMIDFALEAERTQGLPPIEAIRQACMLRFRPIMMTTFAALMSALPIALGLGAGAELRQPLGLAVVGGLIVSQAVTLFITPTLYLGFDSLKRRMERRRRQRYLPEAAET